jgi:hypothetical protein
VRTTVRLVLPESIMSLSRSPGAEDDIHHGLVGLDERMAGPRGRLILSRRWEA